MCVQYVGVRGARAWVIILYACSNIHTFRLMKIIAVVMTAEAAVVVSTDVRAHIQRMFIQNHSAALNPFIIFFILTLSIKMKFTE